DLAAFLQSLGRRPVRRRQEVGADDLRAHLAALTERGLSPRGQARALGGARSYLRWVVRELRLAEDPAAHVRIRRQQGGVPHARGKGGPAHAGDLAGGGG